MLSRRKLRSVHFVGTVWFILCVGFILILALRQAGVRWWVLFSLSGHGILLLFILVSLYLFAVFRGISSSQKVKKEHPLTSTRYYTVFYVTAPFLGALAGCLGMMGVSAGLQFLLGIALGTLGTTFLVWVIVDPVTGVLEVMLSPQSREHRAQRLALARAARQAEQQHHEQLLAEVLDKEQLEERQWKELLAPQAQRLAELLTADAAGFDQAEREATDIGADAWRIGGIGCMRQLREMAIEVCQQKNQNRPCTDYITAWWDGIGNWRCPSLHKAGNR